MIQSGDWVTCQGSSLVGSVKRVAKDGSWADVNWHTHSKRMKASVLTVQHTIQIGDWEVTDFTRQQEIEKIDRVSKG